DTRIDTAVRPFADQIELLCTINGIQTRSAQNILAEIGAEMTVSCPPTPPTPTPASKRSAPTATTTNAARPSATWKSSATRSPWSRHTPPHSYQPSLTVIF
ncbi:MAG: hypothetical protein ACRDRR_16820, partial [Pseudonocardiaceae bacterium]